MIKMFIRKLRMPPDCRKVADILQAYLDGELPGSQTRLVAAHLEHCERCGIEAEVYEQVKRSLEQLSTPPDRAAVRRLRAYVDQLTTDDAP